MTTGLFREPTLPPGPAAAAAEPELDLDTPTAEAPYGYTRDPDGNVRPKKTAGRQRRPTPGAPPKAAPGLPPSIDALKAAKEAEPKAAAKPKEDRPPAAPPKTAGKGPAMKAAPPEPRGPFRAGPIAKGMNRIYKRAGKIIRTWDPEVGTAVIVCATKEDEDDVTVGEAWEELARVNPRIRAFLEKMISGGAWGSLIAAHMPIVLAFLMKDAVRQRFPLMGLVSNLMAPDDDGEDGGMPGGLGEMFGQMNEGDMAQMMGMVSNMMGGMMAGMPRDPAGPPRAPSPVVDQSGQAVA